MQESTPLLDLNKELLVLQNEYEEKKKVFDAYRESVNIKIAEIRKDISLYKSSIDAKKINHAMSILRLEFPGENRRYDSLKKTVLPIYDSLVNAAMTDLVSGLKILKKEYIGQKKYQGFDQRCDCEYGYGPSHGYIYQSIGLYNPKKELSEYDIECCLYLLENILEVVKSKNSAASNE